MSAPDLKESRPAGLELFFAMYAVSLVLGIEQISQALYSDIQRQWSDGFSRTLPVHVGLFVAILLLIVRFFWSTANIRRALARDADAHVRYLIFHLPVLLIQGVLVLFVCFAFVNILEQKTTASAVIFWLLFVTAWNAIWLKFLLGDLSVMPESFWLRNNLVFVAIASGFLALDSLHYLTANGLLGLFAIASILSSLADLTRTANSYLIEGGH